MASFMANVAPPQQLAQAQKAVQPSIDAVVETASNLVPTTPKRPASSKQPSWIGSKPERSPTPSAQATMKRPVTIDFSAPELQPPVFVGTSLSDPEWQPVEMDAVRDDKAQWKFTKTFQAEDGEYQYKLRLGPGDWWVCDDSKPQVDDAAGNKNNQVIVKPEAPSEAEPATVPIAEAAAPASKPSSVPEIKGPESEPERKDSLHPAPLMKHESFQDAQPGPLVQHPPESHLHDPEPASPLLRHEFLAPPSMPIDDDSDDIPDDVPLLRHESIAPSSQEQDHSPLFKHESTSMDNRQHHNHESHRPLAHLANRKHSNDSIPEEADENDPSLIKFPTDSRGIMEHLDHTRKSLQEDETSQGAGNSPRRVSPAGSAVYSASPSLPNVIEAEDGDEELAELREEAQQVTSKDEIPPDADVPEVTLPELVERPAALMTPSMTPKEQEDEGGEDDERGENEEDAVDTPMNAKQKHVQFKEKATEAAETTQEAGIGFLENCRVQNDVARIQQIQAEHADRIARLERRQEDDARMKSVWGNQSPFPSVLTPLQHPPNDQFRSFDDEASNLMSSLHLDADDEPRRAMGATSRANSVRFDESANQNHFSHPSRPSVDFFSRTSSGLGGLQMTERTSSHKSEGRASSAHSIRSAASGRANSLNLDTAAYSLGEANRSPAETPGLAPGLLYLGAIPAIIRCWMNTNFKHDALLYAAVCTGSYKSFLDYRLIEKLGFEQQIQDNGDDPRTVQLPVFFPEAVPHPASSRSSSPAPQLPSLLVEFRVIESAGLSDDSKAIQIFLGSDVLRQHNADILFSSNTMTLFDRERNKLSIPLSRPENEAAFNSLYITSAATPAPSRPEKAEEPVKHQPYINGLGQGSSGASVSSAAASPPPGKYRPPGALAAEVGHAEATRPGATGSDKESRPPSRQSTASRPSLSMINTRSEREETPLTESAPQWTPLRSGSGPAIWGSWRRDGGSSATTQPPGMDWASASRNASGTYQRKDTGIKVLKPKTNSRTFSATAASSSSATGTSSPAGEGKSRFFDEGRRRSMSKENTPATASSTSTGGTAPKTKVNPIGGASAFSWLNSSGGK
ncbi:Hypothetical predicted protein [Lecanosticta acicola]|uniref:AMP-activated protein kinase glycogen-binding domain-containing protein n=1 Tax=Lecanosticta acicola TaxID=111012 RepID=A0AAI8Z0S5_9PEZI|nr:Hypothetical predicted protein [Lecanosticta acicola]